MADDREPPPLFENIDINKHEDDGNEDIFSSAIDVSDYITQLLFTNAPVYEWSVGRSTESHWAASCYCVDPLRLCISFKALSCLS